MGQLTRLIFAARKVAFLGAHQDYEDAPAMLQRELARLYEAVTIWDCDEPDLTFCCGCRELIDLESGEEQWVVDGAKYHEKCKPTPSPS